MLSVMKLLYKNIHNGRSKVVLIFLLKINFIP